MAERVTLVSVSTVPAGRKPATSMARTLFRLALGTVALGREALALGQTQSPAIISVAAGELPPPGETGTDRARYAAIGATTRVAGVVGAGFSAAGKAADGIFRLGARALSPVTGNRLMEPARQRFQRYESRGEEILQGWIALGRSEEVLSRAMAQQTGTVAIEEVLDYLAVSPEMDELVAQQSEDMAGEVVEEIRQRTTKIFVFRDWFAAAILRRPAGLESENTGKTSE